ncbi:MAG: tellurite resistance TerB family protein [Hyphomicrobiaceae bacterium]
MFDARSLLDQLVRGGGQQQAAPQQAGGFGGIGDILGQLGQAMGQQGRPGGAGQGGAPAGGLGGLEDILKNMMPGAAERPQSQAGSGGADQQSGQGGGLGDILGKIQEQLGRQGGQGGQGGGSSGGGGLFDILGQVLGQATQGVREGAGRVDEATGASGHLRDALGKATGKSPDEVLAQLQDLIRNNQLGAGAAAGGLGAVILGTRAGRSLAGSALKVGALALIGGLAYKALQNYQQGRPLIAGRDTPATAGGLTEAPRGSGFEASAVTHDSAQLYIRGMIAAAAADGRIDDAEQRKILGGLKQAGLDASAEEFLANELNNPASADDLVRSVGSEAEAVQLYTAARIAIDLDTAEEHEFLTSLAQGLGIDEALASHIDAEARAAA